MRVVIPAINGLVAGAYVYLNAETWAGSMVVVFIAGGIICWGEHLRRTWD